mgnify:CR=1 FL=1
MSNNDKLPSKEAKKVAPPAKGNSSVNGNTLGDPSQKDPLKERVTKGSSELGAQDSPPPTVANKPVSPELPKQTPSTKKGAAPKPVGTAPMTKGSSLLAAGEPRRRSRSCSY